MQGPFDFCLVLNKNLSLLCIDKKIPSSVLLMLVLPPPRVLGSLGARKDLAAAQHCLCGGEFWGKGKKWSILA